MLGRVREMSLPQIHIHMKNSLTHWLAWMTIFHEFQAARFSMDPQGKFIRVNSSWYLQRGWYKNLQWETLWRCWYWPMLFTFLKEDYVLLLPDLFSLLTNFAVHDLFAQSSNRHYITLRPDVCYYTRWFWTTIRYWLMATVFLCWTTSYRQISGFGRQWKGVTYKYVKENDNIMLYACLDHYYHLSVC